MTSVAVTYTYIIHFAQIYKTLICLHLNLYLEYHPSSILEICNWYIPSLVACKTLEIKFVCMNSIDSNIYFMN